VWCVVLCVVCCVLCVVCCVMVCVVFWCGVVCVCIPVVLTSLHLYKPDGIGMPLFALWFGHKFHWPMPTMPLYPYRQRH